MSVEPLAVPGPKTCTDLDVRIGDRVRIARQRARLTQSALAAALNISFQQIQKYETGMNRISASRLWDIAKALDVPINYFFEGLESESLADAAEAEPAAAARGDLLADKEALELVRSYYVCSTWRGCCRKRPEGPGPGRKAEGRRDATPERGIR